MNLTSSQIDTQLLREHIKALKDNTKAIRALLDKQGGGTWITGKHLAKLTGWDRERMRSARVNGTIKWKKEDGKVRYLFQSVPQEFINQTA